MTGHISISTGLPPTQSTSVNQPPESGQNSTGHVANRSVAVSDDSPKPPVVPRGIAPAAQSKPNAAAAPSVPISDADAFVNEILHSAEQADAVIDVTLLNDIFQYAKNVVAAQPKPTAAMGPSVPISDADAFVNEILQSAKQADAVIDAAPLNDILQDATRGIAAQPKPTAAMGPSVPVSDADAFVNEILHSAKQADAVIDAAPLNDILQNATRGIAAQSKPDAAMGPSVPVSDADAFVNEILQGAKQAGGGIDATLSGIRQDVTRGGVGQALPQDESEAPRGKPISEDPNTPIYFGIESESDEPAPSTQP